MIGTFSRGFRRLVLSVFCLSLLAAAAFSATTVRVQGSMVTEKYSLALKDSYSAAHPDVAVDVATVGKDGGLINLAAGSADIVNSTLALADQDREEVLEAIEAAEEAGVVFTELPTTIDPVIFCVNPDNPVRNLTFDALRDIYTGVVTNWSEVGGEDREIVVWISDYDSDSKMHVVSRDLLAGRAQAPGARVDAKGKNMLTEVSNDVAAIGYDSRFYCLADLRDNPAKKFVMVDVGPSDDPAPSAPSRKFPVARHLWTVYREDISDEALAFLLYSLSPEGQKITASNDMVPTLGAIETLEVTWWDGRAYLPLLTVDEALGGAMEASCAMPGEKTLYVRNNSRYDGLALRCVAADGTEKALDVRGTFLDGDFVDRSLPMGEVTEIGLPDLAAGDRLHFTFNGQSVTLTFTGEGSSGCNGFGPLSLILLLPLLILRRPF